MVNPDPNAGPACAKWRRARTAAVFALLSALALIFAGCTAAHYRQQADKDVYKIIQQAEREVFGHTNAFSIATEYSPRDPKEIPASELIDQRLQTNLRVLTIEESLDLAVGRSRTYQAQKELLYLTALTLTGERHEFGPQFFARTDARLNRTGSGDTFGTVSSDVGASQLLKSGGLIGVNLANDILRYYSGDPRKSVVSIASINIAQPLLRNFGRYNANVEALTQAERNVVYAVRNFAHFQNFFAFDVVTDYFALLAQKEVVRNRYTNYLSRGRSTQRLEERAKDRERVSDVDQARQAELTARINYVNAVASYQAALDQFKIKLGLPIGERIALDDTALEELERIGLIAVPLDPDLAYRLAVEKQLTLLNEIDQFEDRKRKIWVAANRLRADVNLVGGASLESERPTDYTRFNADEVRANVGLQLNLPLDRLRERNVYRATLVNFEAAIRDLTLTLDLLKESIEGGLRTLNQRRQNYEIQRNALELANRRVASSTLMLEAGRAEVRDLVEAQDAQIAAQNAVTAALVSYHEARLRLMLDLGTLETAEERFWLRDHLESVPVVLPGAAPAVQAAQPVLPPDAYFTN